MSIDLDKAYAELEYLADFSDDEKPEAVEQRVLGILGALADKGFNLTRTTRAAMAQIALSDNQSFEEPVPEKTSKAADYIQAKPDAVNARIAEFKKLVLGSGRNFTRTTCSALVHLGESEYPEKG